MLPTSNDRCITRHYPVDPFHDKESEQFVARYIECAPMPLEKLSIQDDIVTYTTKDGVAHEFDPLEFLARLFTRRLLITASIETGLVRSRLII
jgi:hypothetical protein